MVFIGFPAPAAVARGFHAEHLACRDLFFVKYEFAPGQQSGLARHTDGSVISFNVLLNPHAEFDGGGTHFTHLGRAVQIEQGGCVVHDGKVEHAGVPISRGKRMLMVGFVETTDQTLPPLLPAEGSGIRSRVERHAAAQEEETGSEEVESAAAKVAVLRARAGAAMDGIMSRREPDPFASLARWCQQSHGP